MTHFENLSFCSGGNLWGFSRGLSQPSSPSLHHSGRIVSCLHILLLDLTFGEFNEGTHFTSFSSTWPHIKGGSCFYSVSWCISIALRGGVWKIACEIDLALRYKVGCHPHFSVENGKVHKISTGLVPWLSNVTTTEIYNTVTDGVREYHASFKRYWNLQKKQFTPSKS